jgi:hypothetical protein
MELESPAMRMKAETSAEHRILSQTTMPQVVNVGLPHAVLQFDCEQRVPVSSAYWHVPSRMEFNKAMEYIPDPKITKPSTI